MTTCGDVIVLRCAAALFAGELVSYWNIPNLLEHTSLQLLVHRSGAERSSDIRHAGPTDQSVQPHGHGSQDPDSALRREFIMPPPPQGGGIER